MFIKLFFPLSLFILCCCFNTTGQVKSVKVYSNKAGMPLEHKSATSTTEEIKKPGEKYLPGNYSRITTANENNCLKTFQNAYSNTNDNVGIDIVDAKNNQFYVAGNSIISNGGKADILITKYNLDGSIIWSRSYGELNNEVVRRIKLSSDGGLLVIGQTNSFDHNNGDILCFKIDGTGQLKWSKKIGFGSPNGDVGLDIIETSDGGYALSGILNTVGFFADAVAIKLNNLGNISWAKKFDSGIGEDGVSIYQKGDTLIFSTDFDNNGVNYDMALTKLKMTNGDFINAKRLKPVSRGIFQPYIFNNPTGGYWISGHMIDKASYNQMQQVFLKLDDNFTITQTYLLATDKYTNDYYTGFALMKDGFLTCASPNSNPEGYFYYIGNDGKVKMAKKIAPAGGTSIYRLALAGGKIITVGKNNSSGKNNLFIAGFGEDGFIDDKCHPDTAVVKVTNPPFTVSDFNWTTIDDLTFLNIDAPLTATDVTLTSSSLCDACTEDANCNNWLNMKQQKGGVQIGRLDVTGNKITVEGTFNRTQPFDNVIIGAGNVVSKHKTPSDVNYLLRPDRAEITTTNGYFAAISDCDIELNKTYHVAMVYDGTKLQFYRNGFLMKEVAATGNLVQNDYTTIIGDVAWLPGNNNETLLGYVNEVRIWKSVRTQSEIKQYMNQSLPSPPSQAGLMAYYTFDNLKNKQGNTAWDGTLIGNAVINAANPTCAGFVADSCAIVVNPVDPVTPAFTIPDTVCVNAPVEIKNTSTGATSYYWNFCTADINKTPEGTNLGNLNSAFKLPVFMDVAEQNGNYYGLVVNNYPGGLVRLDFGNSMLNTPTAVALGNFGGVLQNNAEGIQVVKNEGKWYALIVGGYPAGGTTPFIMKVDFGADITNTNPSVLNWGAIGGMDYPIDLHVFNENDNWYGFTVNSENNTITRFNFGKSFDNTPTAINLGNIGGLNYPTGIYAVNDAGFWRVFVTNARSTTTSAISRLDFGSSLLNTPTGTNLGNPGNTLTSARDITIIKYCGEATGFIANGINNDVVRLNFTGGLGSAPEAVSLGNPGELSVAHSLSKLFRVGANVYSFITNVNSNSITRLKFSGCTNSSVPGSSAQNPPDVTYNTPGTYNINLSIDDGLATQSSLCKQVVVLPAPQNKPISDTSFCSGDSIILRATFNYGTYTWNTGSKDSTIKVKDAGTYWVDYDYYGCTARDSMITSLKKAPTVFLGKDTTICAQDSLLLDAGKDGVTYLWQDGTATQTYPAKKAGLYYVTVTGQSGCKSTDSLKIIVPDGDLDFSYIQELCSPLTIRFFDTALVNGSFEWDFGDGTTDKTNFNPVKVYEKNGIYKVTLTVKSANGCTGTVTKLVIADFKKDITAVITGDTAICKGSTVTLRSSDNLGYCWSPVYNISDAGISSPVVSPDTTTIYYLYALGQENNLIVNGDFSQGNTGFSSGYNYATLNTLEGEYVVGKNPLAWNGGMSNCTDHTGSAGNGNMMMVNGAPQLDVNVWTETVSVTPNTSYAFSTWIQTISPLQNPAQLQFSINGALIGNIFKANEASCIWSRFYEVWNSGNNTTATISIVNKNSINVGNDFALDDIFFAPTGIRQDSVKITVADKPFVNIGADTAICSNDSLVLNAGKTGNTYLWQDGTTTQTYMVKKPGLYSVLVTGAGSCQSKDSVVIDSLASPVVDLKDATICSGNSIQLNAQSPGNNTYQWQTSATLSATDVYNPSASPLDSTVYVVTVTNTTGCKTKDSVAVAVVPKPTVTAMKDTSVCYASPFILYATSTNANHFVWSPALGLSDTTSENPVASLLTDTIYTVSVFNDGCSVTDEVQITVLPLPKILFNQGDTTICSGGKARLSVAGEDISYTWSPANNIDDVHSSTPVVNPTTETWYKVEVTGQNTCVNKDSVQIRVNPKPVFAINPKQGTLCIGDSLLVAASGGDAYEWSPAETVLNPFSASSTVVPVVSTVYKVTVTDNTCHITDSVFATVTVTNKPVTTVSKSNDIDCFIGNARLTAAGGRQYLWSPAATLSNPNAYNPVASPAETTTYYVQVSNNGSCKTTDSIQVKVIKDGAQNGYYVASAFTPNGDMRNDCFGIKNWGYVNNFEFSVYNRWGERVFYTKDASNCWNGMYKGTLQPPGAFVYQIRAKTLCGDVYRKGTVVLIR